MQPSSNISIAMWPSALARKRGSGESARSDLHGVVREPLEGVEGVEAGVVAVVPQDALAQLRFAARR